MCLLFVMYMLQSIYIGFSWTLFPILMREQGFGLGEIGFSVLVYTPWALKFLYAPLVDRRYHPRLGRRKSWFGPFMLLTCLGLPVLALLNPHTQLDKVLMVVFLLNLCSSTTDIAVDGYATDILAPHEMPWGNTMQMVGYWTGILIGSSVFLMMYESSGWSHTLLCMTALYCLLTLPVLLHREIAPVNAVVGKAGQPVPSEDGPSVRAFIKTSACKNLLVLLVLNTIITQGGNRLRLPMLVDHGFNAADVGGILLYFGMPMSILGSLISGTLISRMGETRVYTVGAVMSGAVSLWTVWLMKMQMPATWMISLMFAMDYLMMGLMMVLGYNLIMRVSSGPQSATNFAVLCAANHISMFSITPLMGVLCDFTGFTRIFYELAAASILFVFPGRFLIRRRILTEDAPSNPDALAHHRV